MDVFWTALVGIVGIGAAFFGPAWSERRIERRRETRAFRRAARVARAELIDVLSGCQVLLDKLKKEDASNVVTSMPADFLDTPHWRAEKEMLATSLADDEWKVVYLAFDRIRYAHLTLTVEVPGWGSIDERSVAKLTEYLQGSIERARAAEKILGNAKPLRD